MVSAYSPRANSQRNHFFSFCPLLNSAALVQVPKPKQLHGKKQRFPCTAAFGGDQLHRYWDKVKSNSSSKVCCWFLVRFLVLADTQLRAGLGLCGRTFRLLFCFAGELSPTLSWKQKGKVILKYKSPFCIQPGAIKCPDFF